MHAVLSDSYECDLPAGGSFGRRNQNQSGRSPIGGRCRGASGVVRCGAVQRLRRWNYVRRRAGRVSWGPDRIPIKCVFLSPVLPRKPPTFRHQAETVTVELGLAPAAETVVVTATRSPVLTEAAGADVESLSGGQIQVMNPVSADDAIRFLPGAVVNTAGQQGGLSSLFVRGGDSTYNKVIVDGVTVNEPGGTFDFGTLPMTEADHMEFVRGAQSTLYGSDAMTSVVQVWTRTGRRPLPNFVSAPMAGTSQPRMATRPWRGRTAVLITTLSQNSSIPTAKA